MSILYERIVEECEKRGITGYRLCKDCNVSPSVITDLKMGRKETLSANNVNKFANYFGCSVDYLLGGDRSEDNDDMSEYLEMLKARPEFKVLLKKGKNATKERIEAVIELIGGNNDTN